MLLNITEEKDNMKDDSQWAYKWMVFIGLLVIFFFWSIIINAQVEYYNIITTNNLFRPLGWTLPKTTPKYQLIGTWISVNSKERVAYVRNVRTNKIDRLAIGDIINNNTIVHIKQNEIQMNTGKKYKNPTLQFLNFSTSKRSSKRTSTNNSRSKANTKKEEEKDTTSKTERRSRRPGRVNWESQIKKFQNASPEDQQKMIEEFRSTRRRRRNNG